VEDDTWRVVEQNVFASVLDARLADVALVCSGFRPVAGSAHQQAAAQDASGHQADAHLDAIGKTCATLTPDIRAAVRELLPGQVLEILTDDPTAADGLKSWTNLTGNELLAADAGPGDGGRFYIRRGSAPRTTGALT
jgi:TusA-related sulfurtransferase